MNKQKIESIWALLAVLCVKKKKKKKRNCWHSWIFLPVALVKGFLGIPKAALCQLQEAPDYSVNKEGPPTHPVLCIKTQVVACIHCM